MAGRLQDVLLRDTRANQPAASAVSIGTLYCVTDEANILERSNGSAWQAYSPSAGAGATRTFGIVIDGNGSVPSTGSKGDIRLPVDGEITKVTMLADQSGSAVIDIWKDTYANYPPTDADSITAAAPPTISGATKSEDSTLTGWTTAFSAGDCIRFNLDSIATITRLTLIVEYTPS